MDVRLIWFATKVYFTYIYVIFNVICARTSLCFQNAIVLASTTGAGSSLLRKQKKLHQIISSASSVLSKRGIPFTVKMRTGYFDHENIAHELIPEIFSSGAAAVSLHGRTRQQRYSKLADWNYIKKCVASAGDKPVIGNGDIYTFEEYYNQVTTTRNK